MRRSPFVAFLAVGCVIFTGAAALAADKEWSAATAPGGQAYVVNVRDGNAQQQAHEALKGTPPYELKQYARAPRCNVASEVPTTPLDVLAHDVGDAGTQA